MEISTYSELLHLLNHFNFTLHSEHAYLKIHIQHPFIVGLNMLLTSTYIILIHENISPHEDVISEC